MAGAVSMVDAMGAKSDLAAVPVLMWVNTDRQASTR
jgi:hypothetical protein